MRLTIVYDNRLSESAAQRPGVGLEAGWGFAAVIELPGQRILFDTGWDGSMLLKNMRLLGFPPGDIDALVVSHHHWDHIGGLPTFLGARSGIPVHVPSCFSKRLKSEIGARAQLVEIGRPGKITEGVSTTGNLGSPTGIREQSIVLEGDYMGNGERGSVVVTGCAHPGLENILAAAERSGKVMGVIGGFHDFSNLEALRSMEIIGAGHCTARQEEIRKMYPGQYTELGVGTIIEI